MSEVSNWRTHLLRVAYLFMFVALALMMWPGIVAPAVGIGHAETAMRSLLGGVSVLALIGVFRPLKMLPLLLFELVWKTIWIAAFGLRFWSSGRLEGEFAETMFNCIFGIVFVLLAVPWGYVYANYVGLGETGLGARRSNDPRP